MVAEARALFKAGARKGLIIREAPGIIGDDFIKCNKDANEQKDKRRAEV
jgi:hypothetical protein